MDGEHYTVPWRPTVLSSRLDLQRGGGGHVMYGAKDRPTVMDNSSVGVIVVLLWT